MSTFWVHCCDVRYDFHITRCSIRLYLQLFVRELMFYLRNLCLLAYRGVQNISSFVFVFVFFSSCVPNVGSFSGLSILIDPSVFSNVYLDSQKWLSYNNGMTLAAIYYKCIDVIVQWMNQYTLTIIFQLPCILVYHDGQQFWKFWLGTGTTTWQG